MKRFLTLILLMQLGQLGMSQQVLSNAGDHFTNPQVYLAYSLGETITPTISNGATTASQGFHQPLEISPITSLEGGSFEAGLQDSRIEVFPNPFPGELHIRIPAESYGHAYQLIDLNGRLMESGTLNPGSNTLNLETLTAGNYVLILEDRYQWDHLLDTFSGHPSDLPRRPSQSFRITKH